MDSRKNRTGGYLISPFSLVMSVASTQKTRHLIIIHASTIDIPLDTYDQAARLLISIQPQTPKSFFLTGLFIVILARRGYSPYTPCFFYSTIKYAVPKSHIGK